MYVLIFNSSTIYNFFKQTFVIHEWKKLYNKTIKPLKQKFEKELL